MRQREHFIFHDGENYQSKGQLLEKTQKKSEKAENYIYMQTMNFHDLHFIINLIEHQSKSYS